jgi:hypothetical protein
MYGKMMRKRKMDAMNRMGPEVETVEFMPPEGMKLEGESGSAMVEWRMTPSGTVEIVAFDGVTLGGGEMEMEEAEGPEMEMEGMEEEA